MLFPTIKVTVASASLDLIPYTSKNGKTGSLFKQTVYFHTVDKENVPMMFPEKGSILVEKDANGNGLAYAPGVYQVHPSSFKLGAFGSLEVATRLSPVPSKTA